MKLIGILRFELAYQLHRLWPWLSFAALVVFAFLFTRGGSLADLLVENIYINSPFVIAGATLFSCLIWLLVAAPVAGEAAARDVATRLHPLAYTTPVSKADYLGGRFLAAFLLNALILLGVPAGHLLAVYVPGVHPDIVGPFRPAAYVTAYAFIALPNAFTATAIQFSLATLSGRAMTSYLGSILLFFMAYVLGLLLFTQGLAGLAKLLDPIGVMTLPAEMGLQWTTIEKRTRLISLEGVLLWNRMLWFGIGIGALVLTYFRFGFVHRAETSWRWRRAARHDGLTATRAAIAATSAIATGKVHQTFGLVIGVRQTLAVAWTSFRTIISSWTGLAVLAGTPLLAAAVVLGAMEVDGVPLAPMTSRVITVLTAPLAAETTPWVIIPLIIIYYAGELVWRERDGGIADITDALPLSEWVSFLGKFLGIGLLLVVLAVLRMAAGMLAQTMLGYHQYEVGLYLTALFALNLPEYLLFTALALAVHVVVNHKYVGHLVAIFAFVVIAVASMFGLQHNLLIYGDGPNWSYTTMRGFGPFLGPWLWFKLYWSAWAVLLVIVARLLWVRGRETGFALRLRTAGFRCMGATARSAVMALALVVLLSGFIFYNTNVLNEYLSDAEITELRAEYELRYKRYERVPQPRLTATGLRIEIYPQRRSAHIRGAHTLLNSSGVAIDTIHVATVPGVEADALTFDRSADLVLADSDRGHRIYSLATPLQPGETLRLEFDVRIAPRGFRNQGADGSIVSNGSYFTHSWLPRIGYQQSRELISPADRSAHGLGKRPIIASLHDVDARMKWAERIELETVIGTDGDQVAVAPGRLLRTWAKGGRRYFHYSTGTPIGREHGFFSARYAVHESKWNDVTIQVFHDPRHAAHIERMLSSAHAALGYYSKHFGPYDRSYLTIVERPGDGTGMHAEAGMITHEEGFVTWRPKDDTDGFDLPSAIVAHEMAHQWTLPYAIVEGAPVMSEGLAWYYALQAIRENRGEWQFRRLLSFMRRPYPIPQIRHGEPLLRGIDPYLSYRKAPFALIALNEYMGGEQVNIALRRLNEKFSAGAPPLVTTLDLYSELRAVAPDSLKPLLRELFELNTFWELTTDRVSAEQTADSAWRVTLNITARKVVADSAGVESDLPMDEWVQIGVFGADDTELGNPLYLQMHRIRSGEQAITMKVSREPILAGIDPYHLLDWVEKGNDDNIDLVIIQK